MPRYFFHVSGPRHYSDHDGVELADDDAAWSVAVISMGELIDDLNGKLPDRAELVTKVADASGSTLMTLRFQGERVFGIRRGKALETA